jgi:hypothetical protein
VVQHAFREFFLSMLAGYRRYTAPQPTTSAPPPIHQFTNSPPIALRHVGCPTRYMVPSMDQPRSEPEFRFDRGAFIRNHPKKSVRKVLYPAVGTPPPTNIYKQFIK